MIRATTGGVMKTYRRNLMNSFIGQNNALNTVLTQRTFNSYAEDPTSAAKAFRLRKSRMTVSAQHDVCASTLKKYETAFASLDSISKLIDTETNDSSSTMSGTTLEMLNDPDGSARTQLAKVLDQLSESIIQNLNQKYGDTFIFAGADGQNVPFEVKDSKLYYRGVPVDAAVPNVLTNFGTDTKVEAANGAYVPADAETIDQDAFDALDATEQAEYVCFDFKDTDGQDKRMYVRAADTMSKADYDAAKLDADKLDYLMNEKLFVDIGLGFQENENGQLNPSSAFNAALHGLTFIGYGLDEDGDPKNIYSLVQEMKKIADGVPEGKLWDDATYDQFHNLVQKFEIAATSFKTEYTNMDATTTKLKNNEQLLEDNFYNLKEQYSEIEDVDMVDAISSFLWAQYSYNAALKMGNSVLSQSLMDYLN